MLVIPAIDLLDGQCVRLYQGDFSKTKIVANDAVDTAKYFIDQGAKNLHVIDLNGARDGSHTNFDIIEKLCALDIRVQTGGGIRSIARIKESFDIGVQQAILGSVAVDDKDLLINAINKFGNRIIVGVDAKHGFVKTAGWLSDSGINYLDFAKQLDSLGVATIIFTDISKDGTLMGINKQQLSAIDTAVSCDIIASGGVKDLQDIDDVLSLGLYGVICGQSIYSGSLSLREAILRSK